MEAVFLKLVNMSLTAGWLVLAVIFLRFLLKKAPKWTRIVLWGMVALRLICPFSIESAFSLLPSAEPVPQNIFISDAPKIDSGLAILNQTVNPILSQSLAPEASDSVNPMQVITFAASVIWIVGMTAMLLYALISYLRIRRKAEESIPLKQNIRICDHIDTPFILGIVRPKIYLPSAIDEKDMEYVIAHEKAHLQRKDHLWKPLGFLLLSIYWFHPLMWVAYVLLCKDIELACDEKVLCQHGVQIKKPYSEALVNCSVPRKMIAACPLAFGEVSVKERVKDVLNYKKPAFWIVLVAVAACVIAAICLLTDPPRQTEPSETLSDTEDTNVDTLNVDGKKLTLDDVISIAEKKETITLDDFEGYAYHITGSGLYIRLYEIDDMFSLMIGAGSPDDLPLYYILRANNAEETNIDIRTGNVQEFIRKHKDDPIAQLVTHMYYACPVDHTGDNFSKMVELGAASALPQRSDAQTVPVIKIESFDELQAFRDKMDSCMDFALEYSDAPSFDEASAEFTDEYFETTTLYLAYAAAESTADRFYPSHVVKFLDTLSIDLMKSVPQAGDSAMQGWLICIGIPKDQLDGIETVDARIVSASSPLTSDEVSITALLETICSSPAQSSVPGDYIRAHQQEYDQLVSYETDTLRYCFSEFLKGEQTDLRGHIMALACQDIMALWDESSTTNRDDMTGQHWFDIFKQSSLKLSEEKTEEDLEKHCPGAWLLLRMLEEEPVQD